MGDTSKKIDKENKDILNNEIEDIETEDIKTDNGESKTHAKKFSGSAKKEMARIILMYIGFVICAIQLVMGIVLAVQVKKLNMLPTALIFVIVFVFILITAWIGIMQKWLAPGIVAKVIAIMLITGITIASSYVKATNDALAKMTGITTQIDNVHVYVLVEDTAQTIKDAKDYNFGILETLDRENTDTYIDDIEKEVSKEIAITEYSDIFKLAEAFYEGEVQAIVLNQAYIGILSGNEKYVDFADRVRSIDSKQIVSEVEENTNDEKYLYAGEDVFTIYISGIDTTGSPETNQNSDVNIILTANLTTRQILMISTPRDYYVPLSISSGMEDKLTHAGGYGIDVCVDTLAMLYEVNIDDYIKVNFTGFEKIIDELGGINVYSDYAFSIDGHYFNEGYNALNGEEALYFSRERHAFLDGDRQRGRNQMAVIEAMIEKAISKEMLENYTDVLNAVSDSMVTSMTQAEIGELVKFQLNDMRGWDIVTYDLNGYDGMGVTYSGGSQELYVMYPDEESVNQAKEYLKQIYSGEKVVIKEVVPEQ